MRSLQMKGVLGATLLLIFSSPAFLFSPDNSEKLPQHKAPLNSALLQSVRAGDAVSVSQLLRRGASPNSADDKFTALTYAAKIGNAEILELLINAGASVGGRSMDGRTALMLAVEGGFQSAMELLLSKGSDPNTQDIHGMNALMLAASGGKADLVDPLLKAGTAINSTNNAGQTPLMMAAGKGFIEIVKALLAAGADPKVVDNYGNSAQSLASGNSQMMSVLVKKVKYFAVLHDHSGRLEPGFLLLLENGQLRWVSRDCPWQFGLYSQQIAEVAQNEVYGGLHIKTLGGRNYNFLRLELPGEVSPELDSLVKEISEHLNTRSGSPSKYTVRVMGTATIEGAVIQLNKHIPKKTISIPLDKGLEVDGTSFLQDDLSIYVFNTPPVSSGESFKAIEIRKQYVREFLSEEAGFPDPAVLASGVRLDSSSGEVWGKMVSTAGSVLNPTAASAKSSNSEDSVRARTGADALMESTLSAVHGIVDSKIQNNFREYFPEVRFFRFQSNSKVVELDTGAGPFTAKFADKFYQNMSALPDFQKLIKGMLVNQYSDIVLRMEGASIVIGSDGSERILATNTMADDAWYASLGQRTDQ